MTWLYILMDIIILLVLLFLCGLVIVLWNKKGRLGGGTLDVFRNDELYEKSEEERKRLKHIDDVAEEDEDVIDLGSEPEPIGDDEITFSPGYGVITETEDTTND
ncbi:MAG: hypothetical protein IJO56_00810 [Oscillospiraceae bacterium]|nr:hypothetical protein [Oscillospiraceae bacterium]